MSYEPNVWVSGNRITAEKLNHMEEGISSASGGGTAELLIVNASSTVDSTTLDKTWQEIKDAFPNVLIKTVPMMPEDKSETFYSVKYIGTAPQIPTGTSYQVATNGDDMYATDSADGYPSDIQALGPQ